VEADEQGGDLLTTSRARRPIMLAAMAAFALLLAFSLVASVAASTASALDPSVRDLVIRSITINPQTKVATARGAVTCTRADTLDVFVDVTQTVGRLHTVRAAGDKGVACDGRVQFKIRLRNLEGRLGPGDARVDAGAFTCTREACFGDDFTRVLRVTTAQ
jgi:hypothetical protein